MSIIAIRGATTIDDNNSESILSGTRDLLKEIEFKNNLDREKVISILFSCTKDLDKAYPAKAARELGYIHAGLMCFNEMVVDDSLNKCIRVMILYSSDNTQEKVNHIYLNGAKILRQDLIS